MPGERESVTHDIARFGARASWRALPDTVRSEAIRSMVNWVGCAVGGAATQTATLACQAITDMSGLGATPLLGRSERLNSVDAAVVNCLTSAAHAFDDTHLKTITHPTGPVAAAALSAVHWRARAGGVSSGEELLAALVIGIEIECRVSNAIAAGADLGWYKTGLSGGIGSALAAARLLGLDHDRTVAAIGLATTQACGLRATHGSMATAYVPALAARNGLTAAFMAQSGFTCSDACIDGRHGLLQVLSAAAGVEEIRNGLGTRFELLENAYKPYPCGIVIHPAIDACLALATNSGVSRNTIERVDLRVHADALNLCWRKLPQTALDAQVSLYHWAAAALLRGRAGVEESELPCVEDASVRALQESTFAVADPSLDSDQAIATVRLRDGRVFESRVEHATGSIANPMTNAQLEAKFRSLAQRVLTAERTERLLELCWGLDTRANALDLFAAGALE